MKARAAKTWRNLKARPIRTLVILAVFAAPGGVVTSPILAKIWK